MSELNCGTCRYYQRNPQTIGAGVCFCLPPAVIGVTSNGGAGVIPVRPPVKATDVCGQWKPNEDDTHGEDNRSKP